MIFITLYALCNDFVAYNLYIQYISCSAIRRIKISNNFFMENDGVRQPTKTFVE